MTTTLSQRQILQALNALARELATRERVWVQEEVEAQQVVIAGAGPTGEKLDGAQIRIECRPFPPFQDALVFVVVAPGQAAVPEEHRRADGLLGKAVFVEECADKAVDLLRALVAAPTRHDRA
ncbi:hypothetical protein [Actinomadura atramentaria]|uniref:hypothetical protein n=1 Tax=Actinomadura atramentaria TaxID=1990 RepID=UPI00036C0DC9|nr:hypothetical protein [Actinomadura atramentaria]